MKKFIIFVLCFQFSITSEGQHIDTPTQFFIKNKNSVIFLNDTSNYINSEGKLYVKLLLTSKGIIKKYDILKLDLNLGETKFNFYNDNVLTDSTKKLPENLSYLYSNISNNLCKIKITKNRKAVFYDNNYYILSFNLRKRSVSQ